MNYRQKCKEKLLNFNIFSHHHLEMKMRKTNRYFAFIALF